MQESTEMNACWSARCGELQAKEIQVQEPLPDKLQFILLSLQIPDEPHFPDTPQIFQYSSSSNSNKCMFMSTLFLKII